MAADFYPPMSYSPLWLAIAVAILLGIVGWASVIWAQTRPARSAEPAPPSPQWRLAILKRQYVARIDEIVRLADADELSVRRAHQELSLGVRQFVQEASGVTAPTMTLTELGRTGIPEMAPVSDVVLRLYPVEFGPDRTGSVREAATVARDVVARWT